MLLLSHTVTSAPCTRVPQIPSTSTTAVTIPSVSLNWSSSNALHHLILLLLSLSLSKEKEATLYLLKVRSIKGTGEMSRCGDNNVIVYKHLDFLAKLREICDKNNVLLIADEVQSGFGRTGKMFAVEHWNVTPDILVMAKGIASGYPLSGIVSRKELMDKQPAGSMGGTYGGNVVACAAANATLEVFDNEKLLENTNAR